MDKAQLEAVRDSLVDEFNGAIKYQPMLQDLATGQVVTDDELKAIRAKCLAQAKASDAIAIAALKSELANDPAGVGYAGKTPEEIQKLLTTEVSIYETVEAPSLLNALVQKAIRRVFLVVPTDLAILSDGTIVGDYPQLTSELVRLMAETGQTQEELAAPRTAKIEQYKRPPPVGLIWHGIPYCRNLPSLDNIAEALK